MKRSLHPRRGRAAVLRLGFLCFSCFSWLLLLPVLADTHYVSLSGNHVSPFTNWVDAATNIQAAVDVASSNDTVLVTNGVYETGGRAVYSNMTNRVVIDQPITVQSANGPTVTTIRGDGATLRCAYVGTNAVLLAGVSPLLAGVSP